MVQAQAHKTALKQGERMSSSAGVFLLKARVLKSRLVGADVHHPRSDGWTALTMAATRHHEGVLSLLIAERADVDTIIPQLDVTPLWATAWKGQLPTVQVCIEAKANLNFRNTRMATPLCVAAQQGHAEVVQALLDAEADVTLEDDAGRCALWRACMRGNTEVVHCFINSGMSVDKEKAEAQQALEELAEAEEELRRLELKRPEALDKQRAADKHMKEMDALVPLARRGPMKIEAEKLAKAAAVVADKAGLALSAADQAIKEQKAEVHWKETCAVKEAAEAVEASRRVSAPDNRGATCVYVASEQVHAKAVQLMVKARADLDVLTNAVHGGVTALIVAATNGHDEVTLMLTDGLADVNLCTADGTSALMLASKKGHASTLMVLLHAKADVDIKAKDGRTALTLAVMNGHAPVVELLLEKNVQKTMREWEELILIAERNGHPVVERQIKKAITGVKGPGRWLDDPNENTVRQSSPIPYLPWPSKHSDPERVKPFGDVMELSSEDRMPQPRVGDDGYPSLVHDAFGNTYEAESDVPVSVWIEYTPEAARKQRAIMMESIAYTTGK